MFNVIFSHESNVETAKHNSYLMSDDTWQERETKELMYV